MLLPLRVYLLTLGFRLPQHGPFMILPSGFGAADPLQAAFVGAGPWLCVRGPELLPLKGGFKHHLFFGNQR